MKIYGIPPSIPCQYSLIASHQLDLGLSLTPINPMAGEHKTPEYLKKNPRGQMPTLEDGEFTLGESIAIQKYTLAKLAGENDLYPSDLEQ